MNSVSHNFVNFVKKFSSLLQEFCTHQPAPGQEREESGVHPEEPCQVPQKDHRSGAAGQQEEELPLLASASPSSTDRLGLAALPRRRRVVQLPPQGQLLDGVRHLP